MSKRNWMKDLPNYVKNKDINHIILPGTHDSGSYNLNFNINPNFNNFYFKLGYKFKYFFKNIITDWTLTQNLTIYNQLLSGIRYFDFRISYIDNIFYISHSFMCEKLEVVLKDIKKFISIYSDEVLVLNFNIDYENRFIIKNENIFEIVKLLYEAFRENFIYSNENYKFPTYSEILEFDRRIICYFENNYEKYSFFWNNSNIKGSWIDTSDVLKKIKGLEQQLTNMKDDDVDYNDISFTLTPQTDDIKKDIFKRIFMCYKGSGVFTLSKKIQSVFDKFIIDNQNKLNKISVITLDFPTNEIINKIINLNLI